MRTCRRIGAAGAALVAALALAGAAMAHAELSPHVVQAEEGQEFVLTVPTEKENARTVAVQLTAPEGFAIDSFAPSPGWKREVQATGSGEEQKINQVTWSGGSVPAEEYAVFGFLADPESSKMYEFSVRQTYSDGSVVDWNGPEGSDNPAPQVAAVSDLGRGSSGTSTLAIIALVVGGIGVLLGGAALLARGGRSLA